jgi:hypothetical protein
LEKMEDRRSKLESLIKVVHDFPSEVSYNKMVPLCKVAFCPGRIIHTNEFKVLDEKQSEKDLSKVEFISYKHTVQKLEKRLESVKNELRSMSKLEFPKDNLSSFDSLPLKVEKEVASENRIFEIREYFDQTEADMDLTQFNLQPDRHEMLDITDQIEKLEKLSATGEINETSHHVSRVLFFSQMSDSLWLFCIPL